MSNKIYRTNLRKLVICGILASIGIVLGRSFCTIYITESLKITLDKVPVLLAGIWLGPLYGAAVAAVSDIIGAAVLSSYGWTPLLTVSPALMGLFSGFLHIFIINVFKKRGISDRKPAIIARSAITVVLTETLTSLLLQTLFLTFLYGSTYEARLATRLPVCAAIALAETVIISALQCSSAINASIGKFIKNEKRRS